MEKHGNHGAAEGSSSNPNPNSPNRRSPQPEDIIQGGRYEPEPNLPSNELTLSMGVRGRSAFTPYMSNLRSNHQAQGLGNGAAGAGVRARAGAGLGFEGFQGAQAMTVGGIGHGRIQPVVAIGPVKKATKKMVREAGGPSKAQRNIQDDSNTCYVCGKMFRSEKALYGHMRLHPNRGWKGRYPPPDFRGEQEVAVIHPQQPIVVVDAASCADAGSEAQVEDGAGSVGEVIVRKARVLPDLNSTPPCDEDSA